MAPAQGWHAQIEKCIQFFYLNRWQIAWVCVQFGDGNLALLVAVVGSCQDVISSACQKNTWDTDCRLWWSSSWMSETEKQLCISGLVVEYIVAIDVTRARFPADAASRLLTWAVDSWAQFWHNTLHNILNQILTRHSPKPWIWTSCFSSFQGSLCLSCIELSISSF